MRAGAGWGRVLLVAGAAALLVVLAAPAAAKTPFDAHGVLASCGQGEKRTTIYMTFLSLRRDRDFVDVKSLLRFADEISPRGQRIEIPGDDRERKLFAVGASLPAFQFIDYIAVRGGPKAGARKRAKLNWRSERTGDRRLRATFRPKRLGGGFCDPRMAARGEGPSKRMLREALQAESVAEASASTAARQADATSAVCPVGTYSGRAQDGTEFSLSVAADGRVSQTKAGATRGALKYEVDFPDSTRDAAGFFRTEHPGLETFFGRGPGAVLEGRCVEGDRYQLTISDRAGTRTADVFRSVLAPGQYEGSARTADFRDGRNPWNMGEDQRGTIRFRINADGTVDNPEIRPNRRYNPQRVWTDLPELVDPATGRNAWLGADRCQLGFSAVREVIPILDTSPVYRPPPSGRVRLATIGTCTPGNRVSGELVDPIREPRWPYLNLFEDMRWDASRVGD